MPPGPTWGSLPGRVPAVRQPDTIVAKNHLLAEEIGELNQRAILEHGGEISMEEPKRLALEQYQAFCQSRIEEDDAPWPARSLSTKGCCPNGGQRWLRSECHIEVYFNQTAFVSFESKINNLW